MVASSVRIALLLAVAVVPGLSRAQSATCGDGLLEGSEVCDDGNSLPGDGCSDSCQVEPGFQCTATSPSSCSDIDECFEATATCSTDATCSNTQGSYTCTCNAGFEGDGFTCAPVCGDGQLVGNESCDDSNTQPGDGCSPSCSVETGWDCGGSGGTAGCTPICGDGFKLGSEACDDGDSTSGDGCSDSCAIEPGWTCSGAPSTCARTCGNGAVDSGEDCDDGARTPGDGCGPACTIEPGWACTGAPSVCTPPSRCGDGVIDGAEGCDDRNRLLNDGCSPGCALEPGWMCTGAPSQCTPDADGDQIADLADNCPATSNTDQADRDQNGLGDVCELSSGGCGAASGGPFAALAVLLFGLLPVLSRRRR